MNITELEKQGLENFITNDYGDIPDHCIWSNVLADCGDNDISPQQISGIVSSLIKKGLVNSSGEGKDSTLSLTIKGRKQIVKSFINKHSFVEEYKSNYLGE